MTEIKLQRSDDHHRCKFNVQDLLVGDEDSLKIITDMGIRWPTIQS